MFVLFVCFSLSETTIKLTDGKGIESSLILIEFKFDYLET